jgi:hypothetical protein
MRWMKNFTQSPEGKNWAVTATFIDQWNDVGRVTTIATLVFSGNYAAGGDTLDFATIQEGVIQPMWVDIRGKAGYSYEYDFANKKIIVRQQKDPAAAGGADIPLPELAAAAYPAGVTGDVVKAMTVAKLN